MQKMNHVLIQNEFLLGGASAIGAMLADANAGKIRLSAYVLRRALRELEDRDAEKAQPLRDLLSSEGYLSRPLTRPASGDKKSYRVSEDNDRKVIKIPVDFLGVDVGDTITINFFGDGFTGRINDED